MSYTYTFANTDQTGLLREDDQGNVSFIPVSPGTRPYDEYLDWVAEGNTATAYVEPGYEDTATAKTTRIAQIDAAARAKIVGSYGNELERARLDSSYQLSQAIKDAIKTIYATRDAAIAAVNAAANVSAVKDIFVTPQNFENGEFDNGGSATTVDVASSSVGVATGVPVQVHCSFDASGAAAFDWATNAIASYGVSSVTRTEAGKYTINFESAFASGAYTVVASAGDQDHTGTGASPRAVNVVARYASYVDIVVERTDDAVQDDDGYIAIIAMGAKAAS